MARPKTTYREYADELAIKRKDLNPTDIGRLVAKKFPHLTEEHGRSVARNAVGRSGQWYRKQMTKTDAIRPFNFKIKEPQQYKAAQKRKLNKAKYYIITWAQNDTDIHEPFWNNIKAYAKFLGAEIHVVLGRYKNPTSVMNDAAEEEWRGEIPMYADAHRHHLHKDLELLSDIKIQPTAITPLTGMEGISGLASSIFGHPRVHLRTIAALEGYTPKLILTTGAVTKKNYTDSKAGKKGEFHHTFGFVIVEIKDKETFFIRQVTALSNGSFTDLIYNVKDEKINKAQPIKAAILGDIHVGDDCPIVNKQQRLWLDKLKPKHTIVHDVFNGHSINHHEDLDPIKKYQRMLIGQNNLQKEIDEMMVWLASMAKYNLIVASANHNEWVDRYLKRADWKKDIVNAMTYNTLVNMMLKYTGEKGVIALLIDEYFKNYKNGSVKTLSRNDSFIVSGFELANHGDKGANGAKGSMVAYKRLSIKMVNADTHVIAREDGVLYAATSTKLRVGYNVGASSWRNGDVIINYDGKAQHIIYQGENKEFTTYKL